MPTICWPRKRMLRARDKKARVVRAWVLVAAVLCAGHTLPPDCGPAIRRMLAVIAAPVFSRGGSGLPSFAGHQQISALPVQSPVAAADRITARSRACMLGAERADLVVPLTIMRRPC